MGVTNLVHYKSNDWVLYLYRQLKLVMILGQGVTDLHSVSVQKTTVWEVTSHRNIELHNGGSAGEHYVDIVGVTGSIPVVPTIHINAFALIGQWKEQIYDKETPNCLSLGCKRYH